MLHCLLLFSYVLFVVLINSCTSFIFYLSFLSSSQPLHFPLCRPHHTLNSTWLDNPPTDPVVRFSLPRKFYGRAFCFYYQVLSSTFLIILSFLLQQSFLTHFLDCPSHGSTFFLSLSRNLILCTGSSLALSSLAFTICRYLWPLVIAL